MAKRIAPTRKSTSPTRPSGTKPAPKRDVKSVAKPARRSAPSRVKPASQALALRGGRTLQVRSGGTTGRETIELKSRDGSLELRITMTPEGPMIHVKGGSLAVEAADAVSVACTQFNVQATGGIRFAAGNLAMDSAGEVRVRSQGNTYMDSQTLHLNCGDRSAYPQPPEFVMPEGIARLTSVPTQTGDGCDCDEHHR